MQATDTDTCSSALLQTVLDRRYQLTERLGGGGASDVFRAADLRLGRPVAVKLFRGTAGAHSDRRCGEEARLLATLSHPGLVDVYDAGWHGDHEFLILRLVEGRTLARWIGAGPIVPPEVVRIGLALTGALHHVHARGIVHRDVKPSNILCSNDGAVFLTDFGISHPTGAEGCDCPGVVVGTAPYLAPEQVQGGPIGPPCDVYALGLVLLECLTGRREYPGGQLEAARARLHREPVVPANAPPLLGALIRAMTALDPAARPSAEQCRTLLAALDPVADLEPVGEAGRSVDAGPVQEDTESPTVAILDLAAARPEGNDEVGRPEQPGRASGAHRRGSRGRSWPGVGATLGSALRHSLNRPAPAAKAG